MTDTGRPGQRRRDTSVLRLAVVRVFLVGLLVTLGVRLAWVQLVDAHALTQTANQQHIRELLLPAPRGAIVDDEGRPLAENRTTLVVSVDRSALHRQPHAGADVLRRLSAVIGVPVATLTAEIRLCTRGVPKPCFTGSAVAPVPVSTHATQPQVLRISEHAEDFAGVVVDSAPIRHYPTGALEGQQTGYLGTPTQAEIDASSGSANPLADTDTIGRSGLEESYDSTLRGRDGVRTVSVDNTGAVTGVVSTTPAEPGDTLVTSLDANVQRVAQTAIDNQLTASHRMIDPATHRPYVAPAAAVVVVDPSSGHVVALASNPSYDPNQFVGGISQHDLAALDALSANNPTISRATQAALAPGSTFKLSTASALVADHQLSLTDTAACPPSLAVGNRQKTNYDSESLPGQITLGRALAFSCDTFFYKFAMDGWNSDQKRVSAGKKPVEALQAMARAYGFGSIPGIDLPAGQQAPGSIVDRASLRKTWDENKTRYCADAKRGYPDVSDTARRRYLTQLASENCTDGWRFRIGEAADIAIGQGEVTVSPLQLAAAYSAMVNGGTLYSPTIGSAVVDPRGHVVKRITAPVRDTIPVDKRVLDYIKSSLAFGSGGVSGETAFKDFPFSVYPTGGKTGTAQVFGKEDTSWFASWTQNGPQHYVIVGMVQQAGTGAKAAAPMVRQVYDGILGLGRYAGKQALPQGRVPSVLPRITPYADSAPAGDIFPGPGSEGTAPATPPSDPARQGAATSRHSRRRRRG